MRRIILGLILLLFGRRRVVMATTNATYNSFRQQTGFCRMQSFDTLSRSTSGSVPMFLDGRVAFGVGLSDLNMKASPDFLCGACLLVVAIQNLPAWNSELTEWIPSASTTPPFTVMVFDQCTDPICVQDFLDLDIYSPLQPVAHGNPTQLLWHHIPCPVLPHESLQYLLCLPSACHADDSEDRLIGEMIREPVPFWALTIRNAPLPFRSVSVRYHDSLHALRLENAWIWDSAPYDLLHHNLHLLLIDSLGHSHHQTLSLDPSLFTTPGYRGGILI